MVGEVLTVIALLAAQGSLLQAQAPASLDSTLAPTLVVHITVDQMRADYLDRWR